jgi:steroid 5-alpha reductase family enzyme
MTDPIFATFFASMITAAITAAVLSVVWYVVSLIRDRNDVADIGWSSYFIAIAVVTFAMHWPRFDLRVVPIMLVVIWGFRLSSHIAARHAKRGEDPRYLAWRAAWGNGLYFRIRSFLQVFLFQAFLAFLIAIPLVVLGIFGPFKLLWIILGTLVWFFGFVFESTADDDLARHLKNAKEPSLCQEGLWKYSRHPNYFGEAVQWWGIWLMTIGVPYWLPAIIGPVVITFLLRFVSGVPMTERSMARLPGFEEYKKRTNVFVPWFRTGKH